MKTAGHSFAVFELMEILTSRQNKIISHLRSLGREKAYRHEHGEFICDGKKLLQEAVKWGAEVTAVLWADEPDAELPESAVQYRVSKELLQYVSPMKTAPGVLFSVKMRQWPEAELGKTIVLETIQDPGNLGTILRSANAFSVDTVILTGDCADIWNPKTVRATMGAVFRQRVYSYTHAQLRTRLSECGYKLYGAALSDVSRDIRELDLCKTAVAIGSEGSGLSEELLGICDGQLIIPMNSACESLNAGVAAAIVMWELTR